MTTNEQKMCGFVGLFDIRQKSDALRTQVLKMSKNIRHRGPDWSGVYCGERAILSHERLSIVDPQSGGQPLFSRDGKLVLAVNGEIYNHREIRDELAGEYDFRTGSDCEVILPLYRKMGVGLLEKISNRFALSDSYKDPFRSTGVETSKEVIFTIPFDANIAGGNSIHMFSWHGELKKKYETEATPWGCGSAMGVTQFIDTYDPEDSRLADSWLMGEQRAADGSPLYGTYDKMGEPLVYTKDLPDGNYTSEMEGFRMNKFEIVKGEQSSSETDVPLFRYAEVLLMKAECLLRSGKPGAGLLVTEVRKRAFKDNPELAIVTDAQLQENSSYQYGYVEHYTVTDKGNTDLIRFGRMYDELGWEFAWEMHRRRDAIRFGVYTKKSWLSHKPQGDYRSVFPIPEKVLTSNPNLEQNPHYK